MYGPVNKGLVTNDVMLFRGACTPPPPFVIQNHFLTSPPHTLEIKKKKWFLMPPPPPPSPHRIMIFAKSFYGKTKYIP